VTSSTPRAANRSSERRRNHRRSGARDRGQRAQGDRGSARPEDFLILNTLREDTTNSHEEALLKIYQRLRPGNPPQIEKARELFHEKFFDETRYRLGRVGRFRLNRKFGTETPETQQTLSAGDFVQAIKYILELRGGVGEIDDIDHLGNRRVRTIQELAGDEFRKGFLKLRRTAQERMNLENVDTVTPRNLINSKTFSSAIEYFFARGELSQVVDQTNPLSQLDPRAAPVGPRPGWPQPQARRLRSARRAHLALRAPLPDRDAGRFEHRPHLESGDLQFARRLRLLDHAVRGGQERQGHGRGRSPARRRGEQRDPGAGRYRSRQGWPPDRGSDQGRVIARVKGDPALVESKDVQYMDVSTKQVVGVSASLIPFLEHDDANRALMGSNMQRQAVPLLTSERRSS
jgi:DNA-directed RNA polymerase subunit beta